MFHMKLRCLHSIKKLSNKMYISGHESSCWWGSSDTWWPALSGVPWQVWEELHCTGEQPIFPLLPFSWVNLIVGSYLLHLSFIFAGQLWEPYRLWVSGHWMAASQVINLNKWLSTSWHDFFSGSSPRRCWRGSQLLFWLSSTPATPVTKLASNHE